MIIHRSEIGAARTLLILISGIVLLSAVPADSAPAPGDALAALSSLVNGPGGIALFPSGPDDPKNENITFVQIATASAGGQVLGSLDDFAPTRLPATFKADFSSGAGGFCTATLIGPQVLLTAAHCIDKREKDAAGRWVTIPGGVRLTGDASLVPFRNCEMAPAYTAEVPPVTTTPRNAHDFALCELGSPINNLPPETLAPADHALPTGASIMIAGYGCTESDLVRGVIPRRPGTSGLVRVGQNVVANDKDGWVLLVGHVYTKEAIICPGDSGGAAYTGVTTLLPGNDRGWRVVAVNSAVGPSDGQKARWLARPPQFTNNAEYLSYLSPLAAPEFRSFLKAFVKANSTVRRVCGYNMTPLQGNCRP